MWGPSGAAAARCQRSHLMGWERVAVDGVTAADSASTEGMVVRVAEPPNRLLYLHRACCSLSFCRSILFWGSVLLRCGRQLQAHQDPPRQNHARARASMLLAAAAAPADQRCIRTCLALDCVNRYVQCVQGKLVKKGVVTDLSLCDLHRSPG